MITNVYFVRHAHSVYTPEELSRPLSQRGHNDANRVTEMLKDENIEYMISSPYKRAYQTIEGLASYISKDIIIEDAFRERNLSDAPVSDFNYAITRVWEDNDFSWEGGESNKSAQNRGVEAIKQVIERYSGKNIVIGTHGNIMVLIMNHFDPKYDFNFWKQLDMPDIYKFCFDGNELISANRLWVAVR